MIVFLSITFYSFNSKKILVQKRPNIILLLADDLGYNEIGTYGQKVIQTPNLNKLSKEGMIFTNFYAGNAACAPSRAVLLTSKKSSNSSIRGNAGFYGNDRWEGAALDKDDVDDYLQGILNENPITCDCQE